jgi:predicted nucleic acid-binding protein
MPVLVDTSGLLALTDVKGASHVETRAYVAGSTESFLVPVTTLPEADYLITRRLGIRVELAMLRGVVSEPFRVEPFNEEDLRRCLELIEQYADSNIGLVDASIVAIAERLRITRILTLDHRHFRMFRPKHCPAFEIVP